MANVVARIYSRVGLRGNKLPRLHFLALAAVVAACAGEDKRFVYSGTIQAESADVGSPIGGKVISVLAADGRQARAGQALVQFDDKVQRAALEQTRAQLNQAQAALADLEAGSRPSEIARAQALESESAAAYRRYLAAGPDQIAAARAALDKAQAAERDAARNYARQQLLYRQGAISAQALDTARAAAGQARAAVDAADAQLAQTQGATVPESAAGAQAAYEAATASRQTVQAGSRAGQIAQARAAASAAAANVVAAQARLDDTIVRAPAAGIVENLELHAGDLIAPGASVATVDEFADPYVRIYVAQKDLGRLRTGSQARIRSDAIPDRTFDGAVESIDTQAQFTPQNVQTADERAQLTFGVKVRIHDPQRLLRAGTTAEVALP